MQIRISIDCRSGYWWFKYVRKIARAYHMHPYSVIGILRNPDYTSPNTGKEGYRYADQYGHAMATAPSYEHCHAYSTWVFHRLCRYPVRRCRAKFLNIRLWKIGRLAALR